MSMRSDNQSDEIDRKKLNLTGVVYRAVGQQAGSLGSNRGGSDLRPWIKGTALPEARIIMPADIQLRLTRIL